MTKGDNRILLGRIGAAHGLRGEVVVQSFAEVAEDIAAYGPLETADGKRQIELEVVRIAEKGVIAKIKGVADRTAAEKLRGTELWLQRDRLPEAEDGEYYHADLVGLRAVDLAGATIGEVVGVQNYGAGDLIELRLSGRRATELVPFTDEFVPEVDIAGGRVVVVMPEIAGDDGSEPAEGR